MPTGAELKAFYNRQLAAPTGSELKQSLKRAKRAGSPFDFRKPDAEGNPALTVPDLTSERHAADVLVSRF